MDTIRSVAIGSTARLTLLVRSAEIRRTKPPGNKPYLNAEFTDGYDVITGVDWDYGENPAPAKNSVVDIVAQVTEWSGKKQLKVIRLTENSEIGIEYFAPKGDVEVDEYWERAIGLIDEIRNVNLWHIVNQAFKGHESMWRIAPSAKGIHHAFVGGNLKHSVDVAIKAKAIAEVMPWVNVDLCVAGGLLQDFGKLWTYELNGAVIEMTDAGRMQEHIAVGISKLEQYRTPDNSHVMDLLLHIVASHHGEIEYGSTATPLFIEALLVSVADGCDARTQSIYEANAKKSVDDKFTDKVWNMNNRELYTQYYIDKIMGQ
jgi:3'-5' exoribonuclease